MNRTLGCPEILPQRRRRSPTTLPDWTDEGTLRARVSDPVPVPFSPLPAELVEAADRMYQCMLAQGWRRSS
jgi:hypothetical protein